MCRLVFSFGLIAGVLVFSSCKNQKSISTDASAAKQEDRTILPEVETDNDHTSFRDSLREMRNRIDQFIEAHKSELESGGMLKVNSPKQANAFIRYLDSLELYKEVFPKEYFIENHYKDPNIYDRYLLGSQAALDSMVAILDTAKFDSVNAMLKEIEKSAFLHDAKWTYPNPFVEIDTNLISSEILIEKIIHFLQTEETEYAAQRLVMMLKHREEILGQHLSSDACHQPNFVLRNLLQFTRSAEALDYLERNMTELNSLKIRQFHIQDPLEAYIKNATDPKLKAKAIELGGEFLLSYSIRENASDLPNIPLVNTILDCDGKEVIPFLTALKERNVKDPRIDLKLWELGEGMSDEEIIEYLSAEEANLNPNMSDWYDFMDYRIYMLVHDGDKSLRKLNETFYRFLFKDVVEATYIGAMGWWANNIRKIVYHFKDLDIEVLQALVRPALEYDMSLNTYNVPSKVEDRWNEIIRLHELSQETTEDVLAFFRAKEFIDGAEYESAVEQATLDGVDDEFGRAFYAALNAVNPRRMHLIGGKFEQFPHRIKQSGVLPLSRYPVYQHYKNAEPKTSASKKTEVFAFVADSSIYLMSVPHFKPDEDCACDQMAHFLNNVLIRQDYSEQLTKYYGGICEICSFFFGESAAVEEIMERYRPALKRN